MFLLYINILTLMAANIYYLWVRIKIQKCLNAIFQLG